MLLMNGGGRISCESGVSSLVRQAESSAIVVVLLVAVATHACLPVPVLRLAALCRVAGRWLPAAVMQPLWCVAGVAGLSWTPLVHFPAPVTSLVLMTKHAMQ